MDAIKILYGFPEVVPVIAFFIVVAIIGIWQLIERIIRWKCKEE